MARLQEHQGKELLRKAGITVLPGRVAESADEAVAAAEAIGYPVALKAQISAGKRGLAGGIRFANDRDEAKVDAFLYGNARGVIERVLAGRVQSPTRGTPE